MQDTGCRMQDKKIRAYSHPGKGFLLGFLRINFETN